MADPDHLAASLLSFEAHALRNHVATLRSVAQLLDDPELETATAAATAGIQVAIERAVVLARVELGERPTVVDLPASDLVRHAVDRVRREGGFDFRDELAASPGGRVQVPGAWAERLLVDLLHHAESAPNVFEDAGDLVVQLHLHAPPNVSLAPALRRLAEACGATLDLAQHRAVLRLPISGE